jgi:hypothetical protein
MLWKHFALFCSFCLIGPLRSDPLGDGGEGGQGSKNPYFYRLSMV